jgi:hypothetical protein
MQPVLVVTKKRTIYYSDPKLPIWFNIKPKTPPNGRALTIY